MIRSNEFDETQRTIDGGEGRGVPLGGRDNRPPTGYDPRQWSSRTNERALDDDETMPLAPRGKRD